jgi:hypothetical protein
MCTAKIETRHLVREDALHEEASKYVTKENLKSGHGPQELANQDELADWPSVANSTPENQMPSSEDVGQRNLHAAHGEYVDCLVFGAVICRLRIN